MPAVTGRRPAGIVAELKRAEKAVLDAMGPRSPVECTSAGSEGLALATALKVLVETQNALPVPSVSPLVPFNVASLDVMEVAASVTGAVAANAAGMATLKGAKTNASAMIAEVDMFAFCKIVLFII